MKFRLSFVVLVGALLFGSCTSIQSVEGFENDETGCDLALDMLAFSAHARLEDEMTIEARQEFFIEIVRSTRFGGFDRDFREMLVYFDPLPSPNIRLAVPGAVPPAIERGDGLARIEFWADQNRNGLDPPTEEPPLEGVLSDHSWVIPRACQATSFLHEVDNFVDLTPTRPDNAEEAALLDPNTIQRDRGADLRVAFRSNIESDEPDMITRRALMETIEVRVTATFREGARDVVRPVAFARRGATEPPTPDSSAFDATLTLDGVIDEGFRNARVAVVFDRNGDGVYDPLRAGGDPGSADALVVRDLANFVECTAANLNTLDSCVISENGEIRAFEVRVDSTPQPQLEEDLPVGVDVDPWWVALDASGNLPTDG